ncbi:MAG: hypothetical protein K5886_04300 [Lachnospiraceae bacterium]|nr:hypothetical protein [Lachnospiraceae bacterium]
MEEKRLNNINTGLIVTLENGKEYLLADKVTHEDKPYYYAVETDADENLKGCMIFEEIKSDGDVYLKSVDDMDLQQAILKHVKRNVDISNKGSIKLFIVILISAVVTLAGCIFAPFPYKIIAILLLIYLIYTIFTMNRSLIGIRKMIKYHEDEESRTW